MRTHHLVAGYAHHFGIRGFFNKHSLSQPQCRLGRCSYAHPFPPPTRRSAEVVETPTERTTRSAPGRSKPLQLFGRCGNKTRLQAELQTRVLENVEVVMRRARMKSGRQQAESNSEMQLSHASRFALRLAVTQASPVASASRDRLTLPLALLLASAGLGLSSFSLKQLLTSPRSSSRSL